VVRESCDSFEVRRLADISRVRLPLVDVACGKLQPCQLASPGSPSRILAKLSLDNPFSQSPRPLGLVGQMSLRYTGFLPCPHRANPSRKMADVNRLRLSPPPAATLRLIGAHVTFTRARSCGRSCTLDRNQHVLDRALRTSALSGHGEPSRFCAYALAGNIGHHFRDGFARCGQGRKPYIQTSCPRKPRWPRRLRRDCPARASARIRDGEPGRRQLQGLKFPTGDVYHGSRTRLISAKALTLLRRNHQDSAPLTCTFWARAVLVVLGDSVTTTILARGTFKARACGR